MRTRTIKIDINTKKVKILKYKQYDHNIFLKIIMYKNDQLVDLSSYDVKAFFELPNKTIIQRNLQVDKSIVSIMLESIILEQEGKVSLEITLSNENQVVTTFTIYLDVEKSIDRNASVEGDPTWDILKDASTTINEVKETVDETNKKIDELEMDVNNVNIIMDNIRTDMNTTNENIDMVKLSMQSINSDMKSIENNIKTANENINIVNTEIDNTKQEVDVINENINNINENIELINNIGEAFDDINGSVEDIQQEIQNIKLDVNNKANASDIPTKTSDLVNDNEYATETYVKDEISKAQLENEEIDLSKYATKDELNTKANVVDIPIKISQLENDSNFLTSVPNEYVTELELNEKGYVNDTYVINKIEEAQIGGSEVDLSNYVTKDELNTKANVSDIPTKISDLTNDNNFISSIPSEYITENELNEKGYLTEHQDLSDYAKKVDIPLMDEYVKKDELDNKVDKIEGKGLSTEDYTFEEKNKLNNIEENANNYIHPTTHNVNMIEGLSTIATTGDYNNLINKPNIPTKVSDLENDNNYLTSIPSEYVTEQELSNKGYASSNVVSNTANGLMSYSDKNKLDDILRPYLLYSSEGDNGTITLNDDISNYQFIEIIYRNDDNNYMSMKADTSAGGSISMGLFTMDGRYPEKLFDIKTRSIILQGNTIRTYDAGGRLRYGEYIYRESSGVTIADENKCFITKVIGYK